MIVAKIASIKRRQESLLRVIDTLLPQVDSIRVYLNDYVRADLPERVGTWAGSDQGDVGKIVPQHGPGDYVFLCDDDILYPPDYVPRMIDLINSEGCIAGVHGGIMLQPIQNYFRDRKLYHFASGVRTVTPVNVIGTGTAAFHSDYFQIDQTYPKAKNMLDVFFAVKAQEEKKKMRIISRRANWLRPAIPEDNQSLYRTRGTGEEQTKWINTVQRWSIF